MMEYDFETKGFDCNNLGSRVIISKKFLIHRSGRSAGNEIDKKTLTKIECGSISEACGVQIRKGNMFTYDWSKCAHQELKKFAI